MVPSTGWELLTARELISFVLESKLSSVSGLLRIFTSDADFFISVDVEPVKFALPIRLVGAGGEGSLIGVLVFIAEVLLLPEVVSFFTSTSS